VRARPVLMGLIPAANPDDRPLLRGGLRRVWAPRGQGKYRLTPIGPAVGTEPGVRAQPLSLRTLGRGGCAASRAALEAASSRQNTSMFIDTTRRVFVSGHVG
jgi:hypothetical protein